jgi:hypothetical protein
MCMAIPTPTPPPLFFIVSCISLFHRIDGVFIGGCNDGPPEFGGINSLNSKNMLDGMLKSAGSI